LEARRSICQQGAGQAVAAGNPAAPGYREQAIRLARRKLMHMRDCRVQPVDSRMCAIRMPGDLTHQVNLLFGVLRRPGRIEFNEANTFVLE
jgi:hypothetical protein